MSIDLTDLNNWPDGAEALISNRFFVKWSDGCEFIFNNDNLKWSEASLPWNIDVYKSKGWKLIMRPEDPANGVITSSGYQELDNYTKQPRYTNESGNDWIDEFAANNSIEEFRAAMRFTIGKYERRLGKKDDRSKELYKIADYYKRWSDVEKTIELEK